VTPRISFLAAALLIACALLFPTIQAIATGGYIFYCNGLDESSYLQYDYAKLVLHLAGLARGAQLLVVFLHDIGLSGGWINFVADLTIPCLTLWLIRSIFVRVGFQTRDAWLASFITVIFPLLLLTIDPLAEALSAFNKSTYLNYWLSVPDTSELPIFRTPEPQLSYLLLALAAYLAVRFENSLILYPVLPLLYPFVGVPVAFVLIALDLKRYCGHVLRIECLIPLVSFLIVSVGLAGYYYLFVDEYIKGYMVATRLPLISSTSIACLFLNIVLSVLHKKKTSFLKWTLALTPLFAVNQQIVSGWLIQSNNFEQYSGTICAALILALSVPDLLDGGKRACLVIGFVLLVAVGAQDYQNNTAVLSGINLNAEVIDQLRKEPAHVAVNDLKASSWLNLVLPKQAALLFTFTKTFKTFANETFENYLCAKSHIQSKPELGAKFKDVFMAMDQAYRYGHKDFALYSNSRKNLGAPERDVNGIPTNCPDSNLPSLYLLKEGPLR